MNGNMKRPLALGRGLSSLLGEAPQKMDAAGRSAPARLLQIAQIVPNPAQPRTRFDEEPLDELVASIREKGILQPLLVRPAKDRTDRFELVAGERRWRAAQKAGLHDVPAVVRALSDKECFEVALIENLQRENLTAIEEARGYQRLITDYLHTQDQVASLVSKSRSHVANLLRLLTLPAPIQEFVDSGALSMGHARALVGLPEKTAMEMARRAISAGLSVRQMEALAQGERKPAAEKEPGPGKMISVAIDKDADTRAVERELSSALGLKAEIDAQGEAGKLILHYSTLEQLDELLERLRG